MKNIKFSIIVPCYNVEKTIEKTIESILNQEFKNFEIILINDGSKDSTAKILNKFLILNKKIKIFNQENKGVSSARNLGLLKAKGEYIYFLDGDDTIEKTLLKDAFDIFEKNEIEIFSFGFRILNKKFIFPKNEISKIFVQNEYLKSILKRKIKHNMCSFIVKRKLIEDNKIKFSEDIAYGEDHEFIIKSILFAKRILYTNKIYFIYNINENSVTNKSVTLKQLDTFKIINKLEKSYFELIEDNEIRKSFEYFKLNTILYKIKKGLINKGDKKYYFEIKKYYNNSNIQNKNLDIKMKIYNSIIKNIFYLWIKNEK